MTIEEKQITTNISEEFKEGYKAGQKGMIKIEDVIKMIDERKKFIKKIRNIEKGYCWELVEKELDFIKQSLQELGEKP